MLKGENLCCLECFFFCINFCIVCFCVVSVFLLLFVFINLLVVMESDDLDVCCII